MTPSPWNDFAVLVGGASGALTGLLFVAVSLGHDPISHNPSLRAGAGQTLILLIFPLPVCALLLVPAQGRVALGSELVALAALVAAALMAVGRRGRRSERSRLARLVDRRPTSLAVTVLLGTGAVLYWSGHAGGLYWLAPSILLSLISGVLNAWLFLVGDLN